MLLSALLAATAFGLANSSYRQPAWGGGGHLSGGGGGYVDPWPAKSSGGYYQSYKPSYSPYKPSYQPYKPSFPSYKPSYQSYGPSYIQPTYKPRRRNHHPRHGSGRYSSGYNSFPKHHGGFGSGHNSFPKHAFPSHGSFGSGDDHKCPKGHKYDAWGFGEQCKDIDECEDGAHDCSADEICYNYKGGYACVPKPPCEKPTCAGLGFGVDYSPNFAFWKIFEHFRENDKTYIADSSADNPKINTRKMGERRLAAVFTASEGGAFEMDDCCLLCHGDPEVVAVQLVQNAKNPGVPKSADHCFCAKQIFVMQGGNEVGLVKHPMELMYSLVSKAPLPMR